LGPSSPNAPREKFSPLNSAAISMPVYPKSACIQRLVAFVIKNRKARHCLGCLNYIIGIFVVMAEKTILFDGVCNLCSRIVQFVIKNDYKRQFKFASLQSDFGQQVLKDNKLDNVNLQSFLLLDGGRLYSRSAAALRVTKYLGGLWPVLYGFIIVPAFIRDAVYNWIAKSRYKWFGKKESCWLPSPSLSERFIN
jgi:predicted DCC family thiol-disulfide oxidoreductase YuxK